MRKTTFLRLVSVAMIACMILLSQQPPTMHANSKEGDHFAHSNSSEVPPLLITELVPDTTNVGGADGYEFIEVYNNTNQVLNFSEYRIHYRYPTGPENDLVWIPNVRDVNIDPGEALVLWIENTGNANMDVDDFNAHFGTELIENEEIVKMPGGMANERLRDIVVTTNTGIELVSATYNNGRSDVTENMGIFYQYPQDGTNQMVKVSAGEEPATPGTVEPELVPEELIPIDDQGIPTLENMTEPVQPLDKVQIVADGQDEFLLSTMTLFYKNDEQEDYTAANLIRDSEDGMFRHTVPFRDAIGVERIDYYIVASNGMNQTTSDVYSIDITPAEGDTETPPLLITEIVPDSSNVDGADGYEFIEVYNNTDQILNFGDFKILYRYPTNTPDAVWFQGLTDITIDPGDNLVLWVDNVVNSEETVDDFNANYGTNLVENVDIVKARAGGGMANGAERELIVATNTGQEVVAAAYNENGQDARPDMGIFYHYPLGSNQMIKVSAGEKPATPGTVEDDLIPKELITVDATASPTVDNLTEMNSVQPGDAVRLVADAHDDFLVTAMTLYYKVNSEDEYNHVHLSRDPEDGLFHHIIEIAEDTLSESLDYYFVAFNGFNETQSNGYAVDIIREHVPDVPELISPVNGAVNVPIDTPLSVQVSDSAGGALDVGFYEGLTYNVSKPETIRVYKNETETEPPTQMVPDGEEEFTEEEYSRLNSLNGEQVVTDSEEKFPYHRFEVSLDEGALNQERVELVWQGSSLDGRKVSMYAWNFNEDKWVTVDGVVAESENTFKLSGEVSVADYVRDATLNVLVQDEIPSPEDTDYTFVWMSDTQFYTEVFPELFESQVNWIKDNKDRLNIEYVFHSGDIVNTVNQEYQWVIADRYMNVLEESDIPYGVLAGNHDIGLPELDYTQFSRYFGAHRFQDQVYYGESYEDNRGHYDLISSHGNDYMMVYMGWQPDGDGISWMNQVLSRYPDRIAILNFHQYLDGFGNRTAIAERIFEEVVVPNENVQIVLGGHHHGSQVLIDEIDDNGDGVVDRQVYQLLGNFQDAPRGGNGYMNVMSVDMSNNTIHVNTYSPDLDAYDLFDPYTITLDLAPKTKRVSTDYFEVNAYTDQEIGWVHDVESGDTVDILWEDLQEGESYTWYTLVRNQEGREVTSNMWHFSTEEAEQVVDIVTIINLVEEFIATRDLQGPLSSKLTNTARQVEHHYNKENMKQAIKFAEKFLDQLNQEQAQNDISIEAKEELQQKMEKLLDKWNGDY